MEIVDVTLRESVYCDEFISFKFGLEIIRRLSLAGIDYIEIGYLKNNCDTKSPFMNYNKSYIEKAYLSSAKKSKLSAMIHPEDFYSNNWDPQTIKKLSLIRICVNAKNISQMKPLIDFFHKLGVKVSLNLTHISLYTPKRCVAMAKIAIKNGASIIDGSILGFGKGAGNLRTELFPLLLLRENMLKKSKYNIKELFSIARNFNHNITKINSFEEQYKYSLYGSKNVGLVEDREIKKLALANNVKDYDIAFTYTNECDCDFKKLKRAMSDKNNYMKNDR